MSEDNAFFIGTEKIYEKPERENFYAQILPDSVELDILHIQDLFNKYIMKQNGNQTND